MIKRFNPDFSLSISHEIAWMRETPEGGYVAHGDYATLFSELESVKTERDALAVENAALKGVVGEINEELYGKGFEVAGWHLNGALEPLDNWFTDNGWGSPETPATDAAVAAIEARGVEKFTDKRGFSFQHGSVHAHLGNGDVMVGSTKFENGHAGICFAPVREREGGVGTEYKWTEGKNTDDVGAVFVISSSSVAGLEVIQGKLSEAIEQLREAK